MKVSTRWWYWWPLLLGPVGMAIAYTIDRSGPPDWYTKPQLERAAIAAGSLAVAMARVRVLATRLRFDILVLAVAITVLCREFHWDWTSKGVYVSLALICVWAFAWRRQVVPYVDSQPRVRVWLIATATMYFLSQAIARRAFRGVLPNEAEVYSDMEEFIELASHVMLVVLTVLGPWRKSAQASPGDTAGEDPED